MKPVIIDFGCKAGGASRGYADGGFDIVGVDIEPQPNYPYRFIQGDMREWRRYVAEIQPDALHFSPPCQFHSPLANRHPGKEYPDLLTPLLADLNGADLEIPWVVENVMGARAVMGPDAVKLCGTMFPECCPGPYQLKRHRLFASNWHIEPPGECAHDKWALTIGNYGHGSRQFTAKISSGGDQGDIHLRRAVMGIDWMTMVEISQAIPPAYTRWISEWIL